MVEPCCKPLQNTDVQTGTNTILRDAPLYRLQWVKLKHLPICCNIPYLDAINYVFLAIILISRQDFLPLGVNGLIKMKVLHLFVDDDIFYLTFASHGEVGAPGGGSA